MASLQEQFGETLPWLEGRVRVATRETQLQRRLSRQLSGSVGGTKGITLQWAPPPVTPAEAPERIQEILAELLKFIDQGDAASCKPLVLELRQSLNVVCGMQGRAKGGVQYSPNFILDAVLFADSLRQVYDRDAMAKAVRQTRGP